MYDILIKNAIVVTMDKHHNIFSPGFVALRGKEIAAVGPMSELTAEPAAKVIDGEGLAVLPGLIDAHGHAGHTIIKDIGEQSLNWVAMANEIYTKNTDDFFWYADGALAAAERLKFGITTGVSMMGSQGKFDRVEQLSAHFEGSIKTGIRQMSGFGAPSPCWPIQIRHWDGDTFTEYQCHPEDVVPQTRRALIELSGKHPRQYCIVAPSTMGRKAGMSDEYSAKENRAMYSLAQEFGVILHTHAYQGDIEFLYETTPEALAPGVSFTHCTGLSQREVDILAESGAAVLHGPTTRSVIRKRCPVYELLRAGAKLAIVTDGSSPDRSFDLWREMKVFQVIHRGFEKDTMLAPPGLVLEMCTIRAAEAMGLGDVTGSLEVGKRGDLITIDMRQPHLSPSSDSLIIQRLVYRAQGQDVKDVFVDGEQVMENRKLLFCDEYAIMRDADKALNDVIGRLGKDRFSQLIRNDGLYDIRSKSEI